NYSDLASRALLDLHTRVVSYLHSECGVCHSCIDHLVFRAVGGQVDEIVDEYDSYCTVCFGLMSPAFQTKSIVPEILKSLVPYRCNDINANDAVADLASQASLLFQSHDGDDVSEDSPTIQIPLLILVRLHCAALAGKRFLQQQRNSPSSSLEAIVYMFNSASQIRKAEDVYVKLRYDIVSSLQTILEGLLDLPRKEDQEPIPIELQREEAGYLCSHVIAVPPTLRDYSQALRSDNDEDENVLPTLLIPPSLQAVIEDRKHLLQETHFKLLNPRTRFRGNDPTLKQGGDPRKNLELRMRRRHVQGTNCIGAPVQKGGDCKRRKKSASEASVHHEEGNNKKVEGLVNDSQGKERGGIDFNEADWNAVIGWLDRETVNEWLKREEDGDCVDSVEWLQSVHNRYTSSASASLSLSKKSDTQRCDSSSPNRQLCCSIGATTWRKPFCIHGYYTKTRRDVSQTPFYVSPSSNADQALQDSPSIDDTEAELVHKIKGENAHKHDSDSTQSKGMVRKGISSVEEEICPHVANFACRGISIQNNDDSSSLVYGMCKFHASGREDMDVRMLLSDRFVVEHSAKSDIVITGRPFVCQIYDAHRFPTQSHLILAEHAINGTHEDATESSATPSCDGIQWSPEGWPQITVGAHRFYGRSVHGVGVSSLKLVSAKVFSNLQSETENKIKHYGCICWSELPIESQDELLRKLGCSPWEDDGSTKSKYPLEISQSTPLRVLHRRSSEVRKRFIHTLSACRIDRHWFRLRMSTSGGTYVKEFVHGDCGRTSPSIGSLLGGKTDITELDCEGISLYVKGSSSVVGM
ncbi:hypothetical protein ACHAW6_013923, partial [Cyclotella cf. meneghiniana]